MFVLSPVGPTSDLGTKKKVNYFVYGLISSRFFLSGKLFPFLTVRTRTNIFTQSAINRESALC